VYLHQSNTQPNEIWLSGRQLTHTTTPRSTRSILRPLDEFGFAGALGDSVFRVAAQAARLRPPNDTRSSI